MWSYSGDPATSDKDEVRFLVQDTDPGTPLLSDEEIQFLIDEWLHRYDSLTYVASVAADTIARKFAGIVTISADGVSVSTADLAQRYRDMATALRLEYANSMIGGDVDVGGIMVGETLDPRIKPLNFSIGMHDNVLAGAQDYGGTAPIPVDAEPGWP